MLKDSFFGPHGPRVLVHGLDQSAHVIGWRVLADAVPEIENVCWTWGVEVPVGGTKRLQHLDDFLLNDVLRGEEHIGVQITLKGFAWTPHGTRDLLSRTRKIDAPVKSQHLAVEVFHLVEPQAAPFGEDDSGDRHPLMGFDELGQHPLGVGHAVRLKCPIGQDPTPAVKDHHRLRAGQNLGVQVKGHRIGVHAEESVHQVAAAVEQFLDPPVVVRARALDHVACQGPWAARKSNQGHTTFEGVAYRGDRIKDVFEFVHVGHVECCHTLLIAHGFFKSGTFPQGKAQTQAHGIGHGQDVTEQNRCIQRVALQWLQGDLGGVVDIGGQAHEAAGTRARGAILGQITTGLTHEPHGRVGGGLAPAGFDKGVVDERSKHGEMG